MRQRRSRAIRPVVFALALALGGCKAKGTATVDEEAPAPSGAAAVDTSAPVEIVPVDPAKAAAALNPGNEKPYSGPIGSIRGVIHVSGDPSPELTELKGKIPASTCNDARSFYGTLFREGPGRELGDVLVAVTGYKGYLENTALAKKVVARGCAYESRTVGMVFGQRLDVFNKGGETFIPQLRGEKHAALMVAIPGGDPVKLFPMHPGEFELADATHDFAKARVFVLKFPTFAVTGLDGKYEITGIPAGEVDVSAYLPQTRGVVSQKVKIVAGEATTLDLTLPFDAKKPLPPSP